MYYRITSKKETPGLELLKALSFPDIATAVEYLDSMDLTDSEMETVRIIKID